MQMDLPTLWYLTLGTLLVGAAMTVWERRVHGHRSRQLGLWAGSYVVFALGCLVAMNRQAFPGVTGWALSNVLMVIGYLMVWHGAAGLDEPVKATRSALAVAAVALLWTGVGAGDVDLLWNHVAALPIALIAGLTAWTLVRSGTVAGLRSRPVAVAVFALHALFYLFRTFVSPLLAAAYGNEVLAVVAKATMYEAVLFSVAMPMAFLALIREEYQAELLTASRTDFLTGLSNRTGFFAQAARLLKESRADQPVSLLAFDLDHFKAINDRYGHDAGDDVLRLFASVARETAGADGLIVRLGGEEFAVLLPAHGSKEARAVGETVAARFAERAVRRDGLGIPATVSVGVAESEAGRCDLSALLTSADRALYRAKELGRNRIEIASPAEAVAAA